jgi:hypothetical protein
MGVALALACGPDENVRFGQPNILVSEEPITEEACTCAPPSAGEGSCPTFVSEIHAIFTRTCSGGACHDPDAAVNSPPLLPLADALATYDALRSFSAPGRTLPYVDAGGDTYLLCNADGDDFTCFGAQMPPGGFTPEDRAAVAAWVACGMPFDGEGEP